MLRNKLVGHRQHCDLATKECPFQFAGCNTRLRRIELDAHTNANTADHLALLAIAPVSAAHQLVALLTHAAEPFQVTAANALKNLANDKTNQLRIARAGAITPLVALLSADGTDAVKEAASGAIRNLSANTDNAADIARAGAVMPLVALLSAAEGGHLLVVEPRDQKKKKKTGGGG